MKSAVSWIGSVLGAALTLGCGGATVSERDGAGSETDWLSVCIEDSDCDVGACHCGVCTEICDGNEDCGASRDGSCLFASELEECGAPPRKGEGICVTEEALENVELHLDPEGGLQLDDALEAATSREVDVLIFRPVDSVDLLLMIDNSLSMGDKQDLFAQALPDLVQRLVNPPCVSSNGDTVPADGDLCPTGYVREFRPVEDMHVGVITSSLGGYGSELDCTISDEGETDMAHLLGSLERVRSVLPSTPTFLGWCAPGSDSELDGSCGRTGETSGGDALTFSQVLVDQVRAAEEHGCGWEASLESWYRFLVDPFPYTKVERQNCPFGGDTQSLCSGPRLNAQGVPEVDETILQQRAEFLRADSLLAIVMLTDENDCSFKASGQSWRLSQTFRFDDAGRPVPSRAYRAASICETSPNDECCVSCGAGVPAGCATALNEEGETVSAGCENPIYESADDLALAGSDEATDDAVSLRCFDHKRRFGVDYLYPVARYTTALTQATLCPFADDLDPNALDSAGYPVCGANQEFVVPNPLYVDLSYEARFAADPNALPATPRDPSMVYLAGIVGVPWQDLAIDRNAGALQYRSNHPVDAPNLIDWQQLLGSSAVGAPYDLIGSPPTDPLMHEQISARAGTDTSVNGGEWNVLDKDDLQYVCTFPLDTPLDCPSVDDIEPGVTVACDCTYYGDDAYANPLCNGLTQTHAKAYPSIRPLQVLRDFGANSIVASICPKNTVDSTAADYGYRPAVTALVDGLKRKLQAQCLVRELPLKEVDGRTELACEVWEVTTQTSGCDSDAARRDVDEETARAVRTMLSRTNACEDIDGDCRSFNVCSIPQLTPGTADHESCLSSTDPSGNGWCYIDPERGVGDPKQVANCPDGEERTIRFVGEGHPSPSTLTFVECEGW